MLKYRNKNYKRRNYTIAVTGDPGYTNSTEFNDFMNRIVGAYEKINIVTGDNAGAELLAASYSHRVRTLDIVREKDWIEGGSKSDELLRHADILVVVWNGVVNDSNRNEINSIFDATFRGIPVKILSY